MSPTGLLWKCVGIAGFLGCAGTLSAQTGQLDLIALDVNQRPLLRVGGVAGAGYTLEESFNMSDWFSIYTGVATNGRLEYLDAPANARAAFYRARAATAPLTVDAKVDTSRFGIGLVSAAGGSCEVMALNGTRFKLTVPSNTVANPVAITMTVITNLGGLPGQAPFPAAVQFQPDGLQFMGAAVLEIEFPTNIPVSQIASFAFDNTGKNFYLTPDQVETNRVVIPLTHFSSAGTSQFTKQQLAVFAGLSVENAFNQAQHKVASQLDLSRQNGTLDLDTIQNAIGSATKQFLKDEIMPHLQQATQNCGLYRKLMPIIFGLARQGELLGVDIPELTDATDAVLCPGLVNCENEVVQKCEQNGGNLALLTELNTIERTRQLWGEDHCPISGDLQARMTNCTPLWWGTLTYNESGTTNDTSIPDCTQKWTFTFNFTGIVTNAVELDLIFFKQVILYLQGDASGEQTLDLTCNEKGSCPGSGSYSHYTHAVQKLVVSDKQTPVVSWSISPNGSVDFFQISSGGEIFSYGTMTGETKNLECDGSTSSSNSAEPLPGAVGAYSYVAQPGDAVSVTTTSASGSAIQVFHDRISGPTTGTWTWNFHRKQ